MSRPSITHVMNEFLSFGELLDDAYWEAASMPHKDFIYDIISLLSQEVIELKSMNVNEHHYPYEFMSEGIRRITPKLSQLENRLDEYISRTQTLTDMREVLSNVIVIMEEQSTI